MRRKSPGKLKDVEQESRSVWAERRMWTGQGKGETGLIFPPHMHSMYLVKETKCSKWRSSYQGQPTLPSKVSLPYQGQPTIPLGLTHFRRVSFWLQDPPLSESICFEKLVMAMVSLFSWNAAKSSPAWGPVLKASDAFLKDLGDIPLKGNYQER